VATAAAWPQLGLPLPPGGPPGPGGAGLGGPGTLFE